MSWEHQLGNLLDSSISYISDIEPAAWAEQRMKITSGKFQGPLSYDLTPYCREPINCLSPYHPAKRVVIKGASQFGKTKAIIEPIIAYYISEHPCDIGYLTGHTELSEESMAKLDSAIDNAGLDFLISSQSKRKGNKRSGDTIKFKEFPMGSLISGSATNHKLLRQRTWQLIIGDDIEAANQSSKKSGATIELIEERAGSMGGDKKILYSSTPELKSNSIIEPLYLSGDQRKYHIPCQCCGTAIELTWEGFVYELENNNLVPGSVEYLCQVCGDKFDDSNKYEFNLAGVWVPTAAAEDPETVSFYLPAWYKAPGMDSWEDIIRKYLKASPPGQLPDRRKMQVFTNLIKGEVFEDDFEEIKATKLQTDNVNNYEPGIVPDKLSVRDGNGRIVLLTCAADLNGTMAGVNGAKEDNARLDYSVVAWPENQSPYVILHGSIGTFVPAIMKRKRDEEQDAELTKWTYEENKPNCVWDEFEKIIKREFTVDSDIARRTSIGISITTIDTGIYKNHVYTFMEKMNNQGVLVQGVKGKGSGEYTLFLNHENKEAKDARVITKGKETKDNLWIVDVGYVKDNLYDQMQLGWGKNEERQPAGFLNFPRTADGLFLWPNFYSHFESEKRVFVENKKGTNVIARWEKKQTNSQNHMWDCMIYNMAGKDIWIEILREKYPEKRKEINWKMYAEFTRANIEGR